MKITFDIVEDRGSHIDSKLYIETPSYTFDLILRGRRTVITGDSGTCKSLMLKWIERDKVNNRVNNMTSAADKMEVFNFLRDINEIYNYKNTIIFIDNGDIILNKKVMRYISEDKSNRYVIITRSKAPSVSPNYVAEMYEDNGVFRLRYDFSERQWFDQ